MLHGIYECELILTAENPTEKILINASLINADIPGSTAWHKEFFSETLADEYEIGVYINKEARVNNELIQRAQDLVAPNCIVYESHFAEERPNELIFIYKKISEKELEMS